MDRKIRNIAICLLLCATAFISEVNANGLNKVDIKRSSSSASTLNVTIFTDNPYDENVAVTKKSDNKYVILMPNVSGSSESSIDYSSIQDIVSDVNLKSVEDGSNKYTKVTLTTSKPVTITTSTRKSAPLTEEQKAYKNLIAQSRGYTAADPIKQAQAQVAQKPATPPVKAVQPVSQPKTETKPVSSNTTSAPSGTQQKPKSVMEQVRHIISLNPEPAKVKTEEPKIRDKNIEKTAVKTTPATEAKKNKVTVEKSVKDSTLKDLQQDILNENKKVSNAETSQNINENTTIANKVSQTETNNKGNTKDMYTTLIILLAAIGGLIAFFKIVKNSLENSLALKKSFNVHLNDDYAKADLTTETNPAFDNIANDNSLNWQEKYQKFVNKMEEINPADGILRHIGNGEYEFVNSAETDSSKNNVVNIGHAKGITKNTAQSAKPKADADDNITAHNKSATNAAPDAAAVSAYRKSKSQGSKNTGKSKLSAIASANKKALTYKDLAANLERTLHASPDVERISTDEDIAKFDKNLSILYSEENSISQTMSRAPKLKAFQNKIALEENRRHLPLPKQRSEIIKTKNIESKHVNLENSGLYTSARKFDEANLSSADLIAKSRYSSNPMTKTTVINNNGRPYSTVTIDEFFDTIDSSSKITASATLSSKVADRLAKMSVEYSSNPKAEDTKTKNSVLTGKTVKAGYNINKTSGFYLINDGEGKSSLIGSINNNITVLKEFSGNIDAKLQVRKDEENVYMVRLGSDRFLVEVSGDKMGVLIEL